MQTSIKINENKRRPNIITRLQQKLFLWLRLSVKPVVKVYQGYATAHHVMVMGHVLRLSPLPRKKYRGNIWTNSLALIRSFMVSPMANRIVIMQWQNITLETRTAKDGFFRFVGSPATVPLPGYHLVQVSLVHRKGGSLPPRAVGEGHIVVSHENGFGIISDIDDTFLISHSTNICKRLYVLFTRNAHTRRPFDGVVKHYQLLSAAHATTQQPNPFFYVSSSEWNLYSFLQEFTLKNQLPKGVFLLNQLKTFTQLLKTGNNKHATKFTRIVRVMEAYPSQVFILLGDDSQMDPHIYASVVAHFPDRVRCVYLRHVYEKNILNVHRLIQQIRTAGVPVCHFEHSRDAIEHSKSIGLVDRLP